MNGNVICVSERTVTSVVRTLSFGSSSFRQEVMAEAARKRKVIVDVNFIFAGCFRFYPNDKENGQRLHRCNKKLQIKTESDRDADIPRMFAAEVGI